jgi:hypothetical protein
VKETASDYVVLDSHLKPSAECNGSLHKWANCRANTIGWVEAATVLLQGRFTPIFVIGRRLTGRCSTPSRTGGGRILIPLEHTSVRVQLRTGALFTKYCKAGRALARKGPW